MSLAGVMEEKKDNRKKKNAIFFFNRGVGGGGVKRVWDLFLCFSRRSKCGVPRLEGGGRHKKREQRERAEYGQGKEKGSGEVKPGQMSLYLGEESFGGTSLPSRGRGRDCRRGPEGKSQGQITVYVCTEERGTTKLPSKILHQTNHAAW